MAGEVAGGSFEQLSNNRLMYETFVHALRHLSVYHRDGHYIMTDTETGGEVIVDDYLDDKLTQLSRTETPQKAREDILGQRRPCINISTAEPDADGYSVGYILVYQEDMNPNDRWVRPHIEDAAPGGWPPNDPFILEMRFKQGDFGIERRAITEPFQEPRLAEINNPAASHGV